MAMSDLVPWGRNRNVANVSAQHAEQARPLLALRQEMDRFFDNVFRGFDWPMTAPFAWTTGPWPHIEVSDGDDEVKIVADLPGMEEKDIEVSLQEGTLTLKGEKKSESNGSTYSERWHGQFARSLQLGPDVDPDRVTAAFKNGVLTITAAKRPEAQRRVKRIAINA